MNEALPILRRIFEEVNELRHQRWHHQQHRAGQCHRGKHEHEHQRTTSRQTATLQPRDEWIERSDEHRARR